jgi:uncharacterized protein YidB (DUF937 family)
MGILDDLIDGMLAPQGEKSTRNNPLGDALKEVLAPGGQSATQRDVQGTRIEPESQGGLDRLLDSFSRAGQGDLADSWVSTGQNRPVTPQQLEQALGRDKIDNLSMRTGLPRDELLQQLSQHLPNAVDRLTPKGQRPKPEEMGHW